MFYEVWHPPPTPEMFLSITGPRKNISQAVFRLMTPTLCDVIILRKQMQTVVHSFLFVGSFSGTSEA